MARLASGLDCCSCWFLCTDGSRSDENVTVVVVDVDVVVVGYYVGVGDSAGEDDDDDDDDCLDGYDDDFGYYCSAWDDCFAGFDVWDGVHILFIEKFVFNF